MFQETFPDGSWTCTQGKLREIALNWRKLEKTFQGQDLGDLGDTHGMEIGENFQDMAYGMLTCQSLLAFCQQKKECSNFSLTKQNKRLRIKMNDSETFSIKGIVHNFFIFGQDSYFG